MNLGSAMQEVSAVILPLSAILVLILNLIEP